MGVFGVVVGFLGFGWDWKSILGDITDRFCGPRAAGELKGAGKWASFGWPRGSGFCHCRRDKTLVGGQWSVVSCGEYRGLNARGSPGGLFSWLLGFIVSELVANFYTKVGKFVDGCIDG